jgi:TonB family protein
LNIAGLTYNYGKALKPRDRDKAHDVLGESLELYQALYGKSSFETIDTLIEIGDAKDALKIARKYFDRNSLNYAGILLGLSMSDMIPSKDIMRYAGPAYEIFKKEGDPDSINTSLAGFQIARVKMAQEKYRSAIPYLISATKNPSVAAYAHGWLIEAYDSIGKYDSGSFHAQELGRLTPGRENADLLPVFVKAPKYPSYANRIRKSGFVLLELTVTTSGNASDLKVIEESPEGFDFAKSALKAAATLRYAPRFVNNEAQEVSGVRYKYIFQMER